MPLLMVFETAFYCGRSHLAVCLRYDHSDFVLEQNQSPGVLFSDCEVAAH